MKTEAMKAAEAAFLEIRGDYPDVSIHHKNCVGGVELSAHHHPATK